LKGLTHEVLKESNESTRQRDEALREKEEALRLSKKVSAELVKANMARDEVSKHRGLLC
jgi:hypothetical protein